MNRNYLTEALAGLLASHLPGYSVLNDSGENFLRAKLAFPIAWMLPLRLKSQEGFKCQTQTHSVELRILAAGLKGTPEAHKATLTEAETALLAIFTALSENSRVIAIENLTIEPAKGRYTPHEELSQTLKADIVTHC